jgi:hypothetical protein
MAQQPVVHGTAQEEFVIKSDEPEVQQPCSHPSMEMGHKKQILPPDNHRFRHVAAADSQEILPIPNTGVIEHSLIERNDESNNPDIEQAAMDAYIEVYVLQDRAQHFESKLMQPKDDDRDCDADYCMSISPKL